MIIQHNISAEMATHVNGRNVAGLKQTTERLSTGYQINRAADNASGLSVTEKMRSQIRGLSKATHNANDAISLIQTAEGALNETEDLIQRMRELAVQSANGTYTDEDRMQLQHEVDSLKDEIDRISISTEFNEMKLLNGEIHNTLRQKGKFNEYGALYGSINYDLAIGGGKITVASEIHDVSLHFTTGASGKGGENAIYSYELDRTNGDLTQKITINLAEGQYYSDDQIQKLIDNASIPKNFEAAAGRVYYSSEYGVIKAADAETYGIKTGKTTQQMKASATPLATGKSLADSGATYSTQNLEPITETFTINTIMDNPRGEYTITGNTINIGTGGGLTRNRANQLLETVKNILTDYCEKRNTDSAGNYYMDENGNMLNNGNCTVTTVAGGTVYKDLELNSYNLDPNDTISITKVTQQRVATIPAQSAYDFTLTADKPGSYAEFVADEEKYKQPDVEGVYNTKALSGLTLTSSDSVSDNVSLSVSSSGMATVTLKTGYVSRGNEIASQIESLLRAEGYEYSVSSSKNSASIGVSADDLDPTIKRVFSGSDPDMVIGSGSSSSTITRAGERFVKRVGTVAGQRQELSGDLTSLMIRSGVGTEGSSDQIRFTANTYGASKDYDSLVDVFKISTNPDLSPGEERVDVKDGLATIHLATGKKYTNHDFERLLKNVGLNYTVELTDSHSPDGDKDGSVYFNSTGEVSISQTVAGEGLGLEDIEKIKDKIEFQIGANGVEDQKVGMDLVDTSASSLGIKNVRVSTQDEANASIEAVDAALSKVSEIRSKMGAVQNRIEHSVNSLNTANENLSAAESQMRDTDMAAEMVKHLKNTILNQSSQALLSQASHQPEGILRMLQ